VSTQTTAPRLEIWDTLRCNSGTRLAFVGGEDNAPYQIDTTQSYEGEEGITFAIPSNCGAAAFVKEARIATVWRSDSDFDEFFIGKIVRTRGAGGTMVVTAKPPVYRLADVGLVPEWQTTDRTGIPILDVGVAQLSATDILTTYLVNNTKINGQIPWLAVGTIDSATLLDVSWSFASPLAVILAVRDAMQEKDAVPYDMRITRNGTTNYQINITAVT